MINEVDQVEMSDARITLVDIVDRVPDTYNTNERWIVKKMRLEYVNRKLPSYHLFTRMIRYNILVISSL